MRCRRASRLLLIPRRFRIIRTLLGVNLLAASLMRCGSRSACAGASKEARRDFLRVPPGQTPAGASKGAPRPDARGSRLCACDSDAPARDARSGFLFAGCPTGCLVSPSRCSLSRSTFPPLFPSFGAAFCPIFRPLWSDLQSASLDFATNPFAKLHFDPYSLRRRRGFRIARISIRWAQRAQFYLRPLPVFPQTTVSVCVRFCEDPAAKDRILLILIGRFVSALLMH